MSVPTCKRNESVGLTSWCNDVSTDVEWHKVRSKVLHKVVDRSLAGVVDKAWCESGEPTNAPKRDDLARGLAFLTAFIASIKELQECHAGREDCRHIRFERCHPDIHGPIVEVVVAELRDGALRSWQGSCVGRLVNGGHPGIVDEKVNVSGLACDLVHYPLEILVRCRATLYRDDIAVLL